MRPVLATTKALFIDSSAFLRDKSQFRHETSDLQILISKSPVIGGLFLVSWLRARVYLQIIQFWLRRRVYLQIIEFTEIFCCHRDASQFLRSAGDLSAIIGLWRIFFAKLSKMFLRLPIYAFSFRNNEHLRYNWLRSEECRWKRASIIGFISCQAQQRRI